jgi:hypothetical protein
MDHRTPLQEIMRNSPPSICFQSECPPLFSSCIYCSCSLSRFSMSLRMVISPFPTGAAASIVSLLSASKSRQPCRCVMYKCPRTSGHLFFTLQHASQWEISFLLTISFIKVLGVTSLPLPLVARWPRTQISLTSTPRWT